VASQARAQDFEAAGKHFSAAQDAFGKKHYKVAAGEFEAAYAITKDPVLLFNIGESWERAGDGKKAVQSYTDYLAKNPEAQDKAEVDKRIKTIEAKHGKLIDQSAPDDAPATVFSPGTGTPAPPVQATPPPVPQNAAPSAADQAQPTPAPAPSPSPSSAATPERAEQPTPAPAPPPVAQASEPEPAKPPPGIMDEGPMSKMRVAAWIGVGSTLALLAAGAILGLAAQSRSDEIGRQLSFVDTTNQPNKYDAPTDQQLAQLRSDGQLYNALGISFFSLAAASAVVTTVLFVVDAKRPKHRERALRLSPSLSPKSAGFAASWSF
jgi:outer membrane biosynthesis protein TonB